MRKLAIALLTLTLAAPAPGGRALGASRVPSMAVTDPSRPVQLPRRRPDLEQIKPSASFFTQIKQRFSKFRPAWDQDALPMDGSEEVLRSTSFLDKVYDADMDRRMRDRYRDTVVQNERLATDPTHQASLWQRQRYENSQKDLARWTVKEIGKDQLRDYIDERLKSGSNVFHVVKEMSGTSLQRQQAEINRQRQDENFHNLSEAEKIARVHRRDAVDEEEEEIPTRLRTRLNIPKARGSLLLQNAIVNATVEGGGTGDKLLLELSREFKKLELQSRARYNVERSYVNVNVVKRITKEVAVDLNSERWTGDKRGDGGERARDSAKVTYSLSF